MPSGRTHTTTTCLLALLTLPLMKPALTAGVLAGLIVSPDLDVDKGFIGLAHLRRVPFVGRALSWMWRVFWYPYAFIVPHRSYISHSIFFGTFLRVACLITPLLTLNFWGVPMNFPAWLFPAFIGLCLADALHIVLDWTVKENR